MKKFLSIFATMFVGMGLIFSLYGCEPSAEKQCGMPPPNMQKNENSKQTKSFLDLAKERYSVRSYSNKPIEEEKLIKILESARVAPTAMNKQPQFIYVLKSEEALKKAQQVTKSTFGAPIILLVCYDDDRVGKPDFEPGYNFGEMDASIACCHMMFEAWELGIGSVWVRGFNSDNVAKVFNLPKNMKPVCMLPIGYPADDSKPSKLHTTKRDLKDTYKEL